MTNIGIFTLKSMSKLACCYSKLGDNERAIQLQLEALEIQKHVLGSNDLDTLNSMSRVTALYRSLGRSEAGDLYQEMLQLRISLESSGLVETPWFFCVRIGSIL